MFFGHNHVHPELVDEFIKSTCRCVSNGFAESRVDADNKFTHSGNKQVYMYKSVFIVLILSVHNNIFTVYTYMYIMCILYTYIYIYI